ncbi:MAG: DNA repair protein RecN [Erysipelotrichaceae bacterium]|nr:DNA repair protein RecN [Erysipelotrichaceae bacterium]
MIESLHIKNFILIEELNIEFKDSFSAFIGETGAGKSIFIDAIGILLGNRFTTSMIRKDCEKTVIEGSFALNGQLRNALEEGGFDSDQLIVSRSLSQDGKSGVRVNGQLSTVGFLKELFGPWIDIHSQNDNQYLLNEKYHLQLLDEYCGDVDLLKNVGDLYRTYHQIENRQKELEATTFNQSQIEIIHYQLDEIERLNITDLNEDEQIEGRLKMAAEKEKVRQNIEEIRKLFDDDGILEKLYSFTRISSSLSSIEQISENIRKINDAYYDISDNYETIMDVLGNDEIDEEEIDQLNQRLFSLQKAKRKYNTTLKGLKEYHQDLTRQLEEYDNRDFILSQLQKQKDEALAAYDGAARKLSVLRHERSLQLQKDIEAQLNDLSLPKARFLVEFNDSKPSARGSEEVRFLISMNSGQDLQPLARVASGGEVSRLMLGLKVIFASLQGTRTIIFDEIDSGVSGYVAMNIGLKMHQLARRIQVFAITHLPSVAACSFNHYLISKSQTENTTQTSVRELGERDFIEQLAILSSSNVSEASLNAARELYDNAQQRCRKEQ